MPRRRVACGSVSVLQNFSAANAGRSVVHTQNCRHVSRCQPAWRKESQARQLSSLQRFSDIRGVINLVRAYRWHGHEAAQLDPLGQHQWRKTGLDFSNGMVPEEHGFTSVDETLDLTGIDRTV